MPASPTITETQHGAVRMTEIGTNDSYSVTLALDDMSDSIDTCIAQLTDLVTAFKTSAAQTEKLVSQLILAEWCDRKTKTDHN